LTQERDSDRPLYVPTMTAETSLPSRAARLSDEQQCLIVRLAIRRMSDTQIARTAKVNRKTVARVVKRTRAALRINEDTEQDRAEALAVYREIQRTSWECIAKAMSTGRSPAVLLAEVRQSQQRIDALLGLAPSGPDGDPWLMLAQFKSVVVNVVQSTAPELAPVISQRLLEVTQDES
jgi:hypothetical protein